MSSNTHSAVKRVRRTPEQREAYHAMKMKAAKAAKNKELRAKEIAIKIKICDAIVSAAKDRRFTLTNGESGLAWLISRLRPVMSDADIAEVQAWWRTKEWPER